MSAFDANLMFRTTGTMTASESNGPITIHGTPIKGMAVRIEIPDAYGANDTILAKLYASADGSTYNVIAQNYDGAVKPKGGKSLFVPFALPKGKKTYLKLELVATVASTTANFGTVVAGIVLGGGANIDRGVDWTL